MFDIDLHADALARYICLGYQRHDENKIDDAAVYFSLVFDGLFYRAPRLNCERAGIAYACALRIKDTIDSDQDRVRRLVHRRWAQVYDQLLDICELVDIDRRWAYHTNEFWRKHKGEIDYWTDCIAGEAIFARSAAGDGRWWNKKSDGTNGPGPLPFMFAVCLELHDLHTPEAWEMTRVVIGQYYKAILMTQARPHQKDSIEDDSEPLKARFDIFKDAHRDRLQHIDRSYSESM